MAGIEFTPKQTMTHPAWAKDYFSREHVVPGGARVDAAQFPRDDSVLVQIDNVAGIAIGATTMAVDALTGPIPAGIPLMFTNGARVQTSAAAATGAVAISIVAATQAIPNNTNAMYIGLGVVSVPDGTVIGRTYTERDAGTGFGPVADGDVAAGAGEAYIVCFTIDNATRNADVDLYRWGSTLDEAHLPGWAGLSANVKTYLRTKYQTMRGAD